MGYKVDYHALNKYCNKVNKQYQSIDECLGQLKTAVNQLLECGKMTGEGANNIESYFRTVHIPVIESLSSMMLLFNGNCMYYKSDYTNSVDGDRKTFVKESELEEIRKAVEKQRKTTAEVQSAIVKTLNSISDIASISAGKTTDVDAKRDKVVLKLIDVLDKAIVTLEDTHISSDFTEVDALISSNLAFINSQIKARNCNTDFSVYDVYATQEFRDLIDCTLAADQTISDKKEYFVSAFEENAAWEEELRQERERTALAVKVGVMVVFTVVGIVASAVTAGAAAPFVMAGIGALSAATTSAVNTAADAYVEDEDFETLDKEQMARDAIKAGVIGGITGLVGSGISQGTSGALEAGFSKVGLYNTTNSTITRYAVGGFIGSTSKITEGIVTRGLESELDQFVQWDDKGVHLESVDMKEVREEAFDAEEILKDEITGGINGVAGEHKAMKSEKEWKANSKLKGKKADMDANETYTKDQTSIREAHRREDIIEKENILEEKYQKDYSKTHTTKAQVKKDPNEYDNFDDYVEVNSRGTSKVYSKKEQKILDEMYDSGEFDDIDENPLEKKVEFKDYFKTAKSFKKAGEEVHDYAENEDNTVTKEEADYYYKRKLKDY